MFFEHFFLKPLLLGRKTQLDLYTVLYTELSHKLSLRKRFCYFKKQKCFENQWGRLS